MTRMKRFETPAYVRDAEHGIVYRNDREFCGWPFAFAEQHFEPRGKEGPRADGAKIAANANPDIGAAAADTRPKADAAALFSGHVL